MVTINIGRKELIVFLGILILFLGVGFGVAYNSGADPSVMGHDAGELAGVCRTDGTGCPPGLGGGGSLGMFGEKTNKDSGGSTLVTGAIYFAESDGVLVANTAYYGAKIFEGDTVSNLVEVASDYNYENGHSSVSWIVSKGSYVKVELGSPRSIWWKPIGSGGLVKQ